MENSNFLPECFPVVYVCGKLFTSVILYHLLYMPVENRLPALFYIICCICLWKTVYQRYFISLVVYACGKLFTSAILYHLWIYC